MTGLPRSQPEIIDAEYIAGLQYEAGMYQSLYEVAQKRIEELTRAIDRKAIAKIIDPDAWRRWSNERGGIGLACWPTERHREEAFTRADLIISDSLAKADAILSLWGVAMPLEDRK